MKKSNLQKKPKRSEMSDTERVRDFQRKLYLKAKQDKDFRFYVLYDKVRLPHFLREAYARCKQNKGVAGIDGLSFEDIERTGVDVFLEDIKQELEERRYKPMPVLRVYIPKSNGGMRPLGIPTVKDRVVQMACKMVIEPIFEAEFEDCSYGFRPKRSAHDAVRQIKENLQKGLTTVLDADLSKFFDTIPHRELLILIGKRISDKNIIHLIKMWLKAPVHEDGRPKGGKKVKVGTPQGGVISPLLANIYLNLIDRAVMREDGEFKKFGIEIVRYADDFVLMGRNLRAKSLEYLNTLLSRMKLGLNEEKSQIVVAYKEPFNFLGFTFRYERDLFGRPIKYWNVKPSVKSRVGLQQKISDFLRHNGHAPPNIIVERLNSMIRGWINYFTIPEVSYPQAEKRKVRYYLFNRLRRYYASKSQRKSKLYNRGALDVLVKKFGLIDPSKYKSGTVNA